MARVLKVKKGCAHWYSDGVLLLKNIRISFPYIGEPQLNTDDNGKERKSWNIVGMLNKEEHAEEIALIERITAKILSEAEGGKGAKVKSDCKFMRDGDESERPEYEGHMTVHANNHKRPIARNSDNSVMTPEEADQTFYGGCYCDILIQPWFFNGKSKGSTKTYPKRVSATLVTAVFRRDGESFGEGRVDDSDLFDTDEGNGIDDDDDEL